MQLITKDILTKLKANGERSDRGEDTSKLPPVLKLFTPWMGATWLIVECQPDFPDRLFGLCDLGHGYPELGYVSLSELQDVTGPGGIKIERDRHFDPRGKTLEQYADEARALRRIAA